MLDSLARVTGGSAMPPAAAAFLAWWSARDQAFAEVTTPPLTLRRGFDVVKTEIEWEGSRIALPRLAIAPGFDAPTLARYAVYRRQLEIAAAAGPADAQRFRTAIDSALSINPGDARTTRLAADFYIAAADHKNAADFLSRLADADPPSPALLHQLGHEQFLAGDLAAAEKTLLAARAADPEPRSSEELMRIHLARSDDAGALPFLDEVLKSDAARRDLWLIRADTALRTGNWNLQADSLEHALALEPAQLTQRTQLIRLYLQHGEKGRALPHVDSAWRDLPSDGAVRAVYADFLEQLSRPADALLLWRKTAEIDPKSEPAHFAIARLLLAKPDIPAALEAAEVGIAAAPTSARLRLARADALAKQGRFYDLRHALEDAAAPADPELLRRRAEVEDAFGGDAPSAYRKLAEALESSCLTGPRYHSQQRL